MSKKEKLSSPAETAWELFKKTGNISYYLLYSELKEK